MHAAVDAVRFVDTGACMLLVGAPSVGKSTLLWRLHREHRPQGASMRLAALLDAVSAKTCRETLLAFCRGPAPHGSTAAADATTTTTTPSSIGYDRQLIVDDVDALPKNVQCILADLMDRFRPLRRSTADDNNSGAGRCRFVCSCTTMTKVQAMLQTRLQCVRLGPPAPDALEQLAREEADRRGLRFSDKLWRVFCAQHCTAAQVNPRAAFAALHRLSLLLLAGDDDDDADDDAKEEEEEEEEEEGNNNVRPAWLHDVRLEAFGALLCDESRARVVAAYRELREDHGLAPADLLDALYIIVRDTTRTPPMSAERRFQWIELIGRAMRGLPPFLDSTATNNTTTAVPWFSVLIAAEKSLL